jgi:hypothetical protein
MGTVWSMSQVDARAVQPGNRQVPSRVRMISASRAEGR